MKLFKSKQEKEMEQKQKVKQSMRELQRRIEKLKQQEDSYKQAAQYAIKEELPAQLELAKKALKLTISERKRTQQMLLNAQIISQLRDMTKMTSQFLEAVRTISTDIAKTTGTDMSAVTNDLRLAMEKVSAQTDTLGDMMQDAEMEIGEQANGADVSNAEIDKLIYGNMAGSAQSDESIERELAELEKISNN